MIMKSFVVALAWITSNSLARASAQRQTISFDFGWKHRAGLHKWPEDPYEPPINTTKTKYIDPGITPEEASEDYNDSDWIRVRLPHDGIISNPFGNAPSIKACEDGCSGRSYIPRHVLWYRKAFKLAAGPHKWQDELLEGTSRIYLRLDGSFRNTTVYLNGRRIFQHECGYTPFRIELTAQNLGLKEWENDIGNSKTKSNGNKTLHTIAVFVDPNNGDGGGPSRGSGWWYEGGGLYRRSWLEKVPRVGRISYEGVFCKSRLLNQNPQTNTSRHLRVSNSLDERATAERASIEIRATFEIEDLDEGYCYGFTIRERGNFEDSIKVLRTSLQPLDISQQSYANPETFGFRVSSSIQLTKVITVTEDILLTNPRLWTSSDPHLYEVTAHLYKACQYNANKDEFVGGSLLDKITVHHGIRSIRFDANTGFYWNRVPFKIRGFCDHDTFAVVGMAIPDRINLFRVSMYSKKKSMFKSLLP